MTRTTLRELDQLAAMIERATAVPVTVGHAYGQPRLESADGSRDLSPRLPTGQLADYMRGILRGIDLATPHPARAEWRNGALCRRCARCGRPIYHRGPLPELPEHQRTNLPGWRHAPAPHDD